ncbi:hypothetical protein VP01_2288g5 [Puccinia sorghi]|uniref:Uncharacterized protein n=1 Tax=Puccinia sorghi TaxID=27349 RepID=A0A0L6V881_9BASI|nr:hypothetical protein VP01_2288g5 [Puccinia sorghi]
MYLFFSLVLLDIYSSTQNITSRLLEVISNAQGTIHTEKIPNGTFLRCYHSNTGDLDRCVIQVSQADLSSISKMLGRSRRDGKQVLGIIFVKSSQKKGNNLVSEFENFKYHSDNDQMDTLAINTSCFRISFFLDTLYVWLKANINRQRANLLLENSVGYITLSQDDTNYKLEATLERSDWIREKMRGGKIDKFG